MDCDCCLQPIAGIMYEHGPTGVIVCAECHDMITNSPTEEYEDEEMEELTLLVGAI